MCIDRLAGRIYNWAKRCEFDFIISVEEIDRLKDLSGSVTIDVTDRNLSSQQIAKLKEFAWREQTYLRDSNWFGGTWTLTDFLSAEKILDDFCEGIDKNLSPFERFVCAYHFATSRKYRFAPKGSPFQECRSYVDVLNRGSCVCVGFATILKRLCEKMAIECAVQGCLAKDREGRVVNHANCVAFIDDPKYDMRALLYSDPRLDCIDFEPEPKGAWNLNMLALPMTDVGKIMIKLWDDDTIIEMNDFQSIYYSRKPSKSDLEYFSKFFSSSDPKTIMGLKYSKGVSLDQIATALKNIGLSLDQIASTRENYIRRKSLFLQEFDASQEIADEWNRRLKFCDYILDYVSHKGRQDEDFKLDCATLVYVLYKNFFGVDLLEGGYGGSWTGKIATSSVGNPPKLIDENAPLESKINFIDTKCKAGDVLLFHRQSRGEDHTTDENYYPGHCAIYLGNHKYIDSRLTTRGTIAIVDVEDDDYMQYFVGSKDIISSMDKTAEVQPDK